MGQHGAGRGQIRESGRRGVVRDVGGALIQKMEIFVGHVARPLGPWARSGTDRYIASRIARDIKLRTDPERLRVQTLSIARWEEKFGEVR